MKQLLTLFRNKLDGLKLPLSEDSMFNVRVNKEIVTIICIGVKITSL